MSFVRVIVIMLVVGVTALSIDAQALACEFLCASPQPGAAAPHQHGAEAAAMPSQNEGSHAEHMGHAGDMDHASHDTVPSPQEQLQQCVTVDDVTLGSSATRIASHTLVVVGQPAEMTVAPTAELPAAAAISESPPARNGPLQISSVLRI